MSREALFDTLNILLTSNKTRQRDRQISFLVELGKVRLDFLGIARSAACKGNPFRTFEFRNTKSLQQNLCEPLGWFESISLHLAHGDFRTANLICKGSLSQVKHAA